MYKVFADHKVVQMYRCFLIVCLFVILVLFILSQIWFVVFHMLTTRCCLPVTLTRTLHKLLHVTPDYSYHHPFHCTDHTHKAMRRRLGFKSNFAYQHTKNTCIYTYKHSHIHINFHAYTLLNTRTYIYTSKHSHIHIHFHAYTLLNTRTYI